MEIRKRIEKDGEEREYIFFKVKFNKFRDVSGTIEHTVIDREEMEECECVLTLPENYSPDGEETPLIIAFHGAGSRVCEADDKIGGLSYVSKCIDAGYAALDVNGSALHGLTMGCPEHMFAIYKAYRYAVRHYNLTERVLVAGASMGGHSAMNFAHTFPSITLALGLFYPRLNMDGVNVGDHYCIGTWDKKHKGVSVVSTHERIVEIYRFPEDEWCEANTIGFNPYRIRSFVDHNGDRIVIPPCPIKIWQGTADTVVDPIMVEEFVESVRRSGSYIELRKLEGIGHKISDVMREEQVMWFNRFI